MLWNDRMASELHCSVSYHGRETAKGRGEPRYDQKWSIESLDRLKPKLGIEDMSRCCREIDGGRLHLIEYCDLRENFRRSSSASLLSCSASSSVSRSSNSRYGKLDSRLVDILYVWDSGASNPKAIRKCRNAKRDSEQTSSIVNQNGWREQNRTASLVVIPS